MDLHTVKINTFNGRPLLRGKKELEMSPITRLNIVSKTYTGNTVLPFNKDRGYLMVQMVTAAGTVELGQGGGKLPLAISGFFEPNVAPTGVVSIETTGTYIVIEG